MQSFDLILMQQQFPPSFRIMLRVTGVIIDSDTHTNQPGFLILDAGIAILDIAFAVSQGFHLAAG